MYFNTKCLKRIVSLVIMVAIFIFLSGYNQNTFAANAASNSQNPAEFYKGKNIIIMCGFGAGGGSDMAGRLFSSFLGSVTGAMSGVINDSSGAGLVVRNNMYKTVEKDGLTLQIDPAGSLITNWLLDIKGVEYDVKDFEYIGGFYTARMGIVVATKGRYNSVDKLRSGKNLIFGSSSPASLPSMVCAASIDILGLDAKIAPGFKSVGAQRISVAQGELAAHASAIDTASVDAEGGERKILFVLSTQRDPNFKDIPAVSEFVNLTDYHKKLIKAIPDDYKMIFAPPGTPKERVKFLRDAFDKIAAEKGFQTGMTKIYGKYEGSISGEELESYVKELASNKDDYMKLYKNVLNKYMK